MNTNNMFFTTKSHSVGFFFLNL